jgi:receptor expression-enhancing protein 5/6
MAPTMGRYFSQSGSTASGVRSKVDGLDKSE